MTRWLLSSLLALALFGVAGARDGHPAEPSLTDVTPDGVQRGTETVLVLSGRRLEGPLELVTYDPGITVLRLEAKSSKKVEATVRIAADAPLGEHRVRLRTKSGWTELRTVWVGALPCLNEQENNSRFEQPQEVPFGCTVHGRVTSEDVDYFVVEAKKGQRITAEVEGIRLGLTLFDPYVAILDARRFELAAADDTALLRQDAFAATMVPEDGRYVIAVRESAYGGSGACRYRLHIGPLPRPTAVFPSGGQPGEEVELTYLGDPAGPQKVKTKLSTQNGVMNVHLEQNGHISPSANRLRVMRFPSINEQEPNDDAKQCTAAPKPAPVAFNGIVSKERDRDWFSFEAKKGQNINVWVHARTLGSPLDPTVLILDPKGKSVFRNDDGFGLDSRGQFRAPRDGRYLMRVRDHLYKGGEDMVYRVEIRVVGAGLSLIRPPVRRNDSQSLQWAAVPRGNRAFVMLRLNRREFGDEVNLTCADMPPGVTMHAPQIRRETNLVPVVFEATADAPLEGRLCKLEGQSAKDKRVRGRFSQRVDLVRGNPNNAPYYWTSVYKFPVCVIEEAPFKVKIIPPKTPLLRDGRLALKVVVERAEGFTAKIRLTMPFKSPGVNARGVVDIPKGKNEGIYVLSANGNAATGKWQTCVQAAAAVRGGGTVYVASQHIDLEVSPQLVTGTIPLTVTQQGEPTDVICKLTQVTAFDEEAEIILSGLPAGVTAAPQKITKAATEVVFPVTTTANSPAGQHKSLFCEVRVRRGGGLMSQTLAGGGVLRIDKPRAKPKPKPKKPVVAKKEPPKPKAKPKRRPTRLEQLRIEAAERAKAASGQTTTGSGGGQR
ncbi:MAG: pre-peptidase C-terminal domain-containing protein [Planctomycetota bacterium]|nr:pre-peptidase C-terminal domain-containing protein [Planctomycetota bacterium]